MDAGWNVFMVSGALPVLKQAERVAGNQTAARGSVDHHPLEPEQIEVAVQRRNAFITSEPARNHADLVGFVKRPLCRERADGAFHFALLDVNLCLGKQVVV